MRPYTLMFGVEMLNEHERHARIGRELLQQLGECLETAGGRANAHNRKGGAAWELARCGRDGPLEFARGLWGGFCRLFPFLTSHNPSVIH